MELNIHIYTCTCMRRGIFMLMIMNFCALALINNNISIYTCTKRRRTCTHVHHVHIDVKAYVRIHTYISILSSLIINHILTLQSGSTHYIFPNPHAHIKHKNQLTQPAARIHVHVPYVHAYVFPQCPSNVNGLDAVDRRAGSS